MKKKVQLRPGCSHSVMTYKTVKKDGKETVRTEITEYGPGDILEFTENELRSFGDKVVVIGKADGDQE